LNLTRQTKLISLSKPVLIFQSNFNIVSTCILWLCGILLNRKCWSTFIK